MAGTIKASTISQENYDALRKRAISTQLIRKTVPLASIRVINSGAIETNGNIIAMSSKAFRQLARILGVPIQFQGRVDKYFGEDAKSSIVNKMKTALIADGMSTITMVANPLSKEIVGFLKMESQYTSNRAFLDLMEGVINDKGLEVRDFSIDPYDGGITISCFNERAEYMIGDMKDEVFQGGVTFSNSLDGGSQVSPYMNRLVCANGMIGEAFAESLKIKNLSKVSIEEFRTHLDQLAKRDFKPMGFENRVIQASKTKASFAELEAAANLIIKSSGAKPEEISGWIPYQETMAKFAQYGSPTLLMTSGQKANAKTGTSVWEVINGLTHYSTHNHALKVGDYERRRVQKEAGAMLVNTFHMENQVNSPFS